MLVPHGWLWPSGDSKLKLSGVPFRAISESAVWLLGSGDFLSGAGGFKVNDNDLFDAVSFAFDLFDEDDNDEDDEDDKDEEDAEDSEDEDNAGGTVASDVSEN
eukprot:TCONS_00034750-protein